MTNRSHILRMCRINFRGRAQPMLQMDTGYARQPSWACKRVVKSKYIPGLWDYLSSFLFSAICVVVSGNNSGWIYFMGMSISRSDQLILVIQNQFLAWLRHLLYFHIIQRQTVKLWTWINQLELEPLPLGSTVFWFQQKDCTWKE